MYNSWFQTEKYGIRINPFIWHVTFTSAILLQMDSRSVLKSMDSFSGEICSVNKHHGLFLDKKQRVLFHTWIILAFKKNIILF